MDRDFCKNMSEISRKHLDITYTWEVTRQNTG